MANGQVRHDLSKLTTKRRIVGERGNHPASQVRKGRGIARPQPEHCRPEPARPIKPDLERQDRGEHARKPIALGSAEPASWHERRQDRDVRRDAQAGIGVEVSPMTADHRLGCRNFDNQRGLPVTRRHRASVSGRVGTTGDRPSPARETFDNVADVELRTAITETQHTYDHIATEYARRKSVTSPRIVDDIRALAASLPPAAIVADVGCGPGSEAALIREHGFRVVGFDLSLGQLRVAGGTDLAQADMRHLPLRSGSVDAIWCQAALLHIPREAVPMVLAEFARTVRPGGPLSLHVAEGDGEGFEAASGYESDRRRWFTLHREPDLIALLAAAGFTVDRVSRSRSHRDWLDLRAHRLSGARPPGSPVELRPATAADLPAIQRVIAAAYDKYLSRMDRPPAPFLHDYSSAIDSGAIWVTGTPVAGLISLTAIDDVMLIENVAVHPAQQGTGLGRRLMEFAEQQARERRIHRLALYTNEVMTENQAIYAHLGYRVTDRRFEAGYRRVYLEKTLPAS